MMTLLWLIVILLSYGLFISQREDARRQLKVLLDKEAEHKRHDEALDYVLRYYLLDRMNPYVVRPGFEEKRCLHCFHPEGYGHHLECPWARLESLTRTLYPK